MCATVPAEQDSLDPADQAGSRDRSAPQEGDTMILATTKVKDLDHFLEVYGAAGADKRGSHGSKGATRLPRPDRGGPRLGGLRLGRGGLDGVRHRPGDPRASCRRPVTWAGRRWASSSARSAPRTAFTSGLWPRLARGQRPSNQMPISRSADSGASEPWTRFCWTAWPQSRPRSPRIVPGSSGGRVGGAGQRAEALDAPLALDDHRHDRSGEHELHQRLVERLALVLGVVRGRAARGWRCGARAGPGVALGLDPPDHLAGEATAYAVGLDQDQGALHGRHPIEGMLTSRPAGA